MQEPDLPSTVFSAPLAALRCWVEAGVEALVEETPLAWLLAEDVARGKGAAGAEPGRASGKTAAAAPDLPTIAQIRAQDAAPAGGAPGGARQLRGQTDLAGPAETRRLAAAAADLASLRQSVEGFEGCPLKRSATNTVFADGDPASRVMLIGEAPGAEEDRRGLPFVGAAGQLLDRMMAAIGRSRHDSGDHGVYITNILFWRPPGNRKPTDQEILLCLPFVLRHIELVRPKAILCLGGTAAPALLDSRQSISALRGRWAQISVGDQTIPVLPTFHPAYLLRTPAVKASSWTDLQRFRERIDA